MSKRVQFSTLSASVGDGLSSTTKNGLLKKSGKSSEAKDELCLRFEIKLDDSLTDGCPEFSYKELVEKNRAEHDLPDDPDSVRERAEEEAMRKMAKNLEAKYGSAGKKKRNYKRQNDDYIDKGYGYDEDDSFIDNEEAYDELIPSTLTTKYGGFYINCGKLEFRPCSDAEEDEVLNEDGDDESMEFRNSSKKRRHNSSGQNKRKRKKQMIESEDESQDNSREEDLENSEDESDEESESSSSSDDSQQPTQQPAQPQPSAKSKSKKAANTSNSVRPQTTIDSIIDSVLNNSGKGSKTTNSSIKVGTPVDANDDEPHQIPDDFPDAVKEKLNQLKEFGSSQTNKKSRTYIDEENKLLFEIDNTLQNCPGSVRSSVITWLLGYLNLSKSNQLFKRINNVRKPYEESKLKQNISTLRMEVSYVIEDNEAYQDAVRQWEEDKKNGLDVGDKPDDVGFKFNDSIRDLLRKILASKRILVNLENIKGKQEEDNITNFFNNEIKNIWPPNWISNSTLLRTAGFLSKYSQTSDPAKSSVSVISHNKKSSPPSSRAPDVANNQPLNLNVPKTSQQPPAQNHSFSGSSPSNVAKSKQKDLSMEKSGKQHEKAASVPNKSEQSLLKKQQESKSKSQPPTAKGPSDSKSFVKEQFKLYKREIADTTHLAISMPGQQQPNNSATKLANFDRQLTPQQTQQLIKEQTLRLQRLREHHQQIASQAASQTASQATKSSSSFDKIQNLTNYVPAHSSSSSINNSATNRPANFSSTPPNHPATSKKLQFEQHSQFSQPQQKPPSAGKQSINKSLEVDFNIDKAIKKSLIEDHQQQQSLKQQISQQLQRSNSLSSGSGGLQQPSKANLTPKPAHSNNSQQNLTYQQQQLLTQLNHIAVQQYVSKYTEAVKMMQQSGSVSPSDLSTNLNSRNSYPNFTNTGNNQIQTQPNQTTNQTVTSGPLSATGQQLGSGQLGSGQMSSGQLGSQMGSGQLTSGQLNSNQLSGKISTGQTYSRNAVVQGSPNVPTINTVPSITVSTIAISVSPNQIGNSIGNPNQISNPNQIGNSSQIGKPSQVHSPNQIGNPNQVSSPNQIANQIVNPNQISNPMLVQGDLNSLLGSQSTGSVRYASPTSNAPIGQYATYSPVPDLASQSGLQKTTNVYADYMSLSPQIQQQIQQQYQRNQMQQRQDGKV